MESFLSRLYKSDVEGEGVMYSFSFFPLRSVYSIRELAKAVLVKFCGFFLGGRTYGI